MDISEIFMAAFAGKATNDIVDLIKPKLRFYIQLAWKNLIDENQDETIHKDVIQSLHEYGNVVADLIKTIPDKHIKTPDLDITGPILETSKFYLHQPGIRDLFAKLIAADLDDRKINLIHHAYVNIIQQLNSNDIRLLREITFHQDSLFAYTQKMGEQNVITVADIFLNDSIPEYEDQNVVSINNLERLHLIQIIRPFMGYTNNVDQSDPKLIPLKRTRFYQEQELKKDIPANHITESWITGYYVRITAFGQNFKNLCL